MSELGNGKAWAQTVVALYSEGYSDAEVAAELKLPISSYYKHMNENPAFAKLVEYGRTLSLAFWEGLGRKHITNKSFNNAMWAFYMKNKHGWADKTETTSTTENTNINLDALKQEVEGLVKRHIKTYTPELTDAQRVLSSLSEGMSDESH